jgi:hypothetical protein
MNQISGTVSFATTRHTQLIPPSIAGTSELKCLKVVAELQRQQQHSYVLNAAHMHFRLLPRIQTQ